MTPNLGTKTLGSEWIGVSLDDNINGYQVLSERGEPMGTVQDYVFDETGRLRYLVVDFGFWIFGKRVLVPVGLVGQIDDSRRRVALRLPSREIFENLPGFEDLAELEADYEFDLIRGYQNHVGNRSRASVERFFEVPERLRPLQERLTRECGSSETPLSEGGCI
ncbi:MAG TPA: PRC-barrel domain-containing protein [Coleofasciculaceae cyanobacterium]